jgi:hypothetical protein
MRPACGVGGATIGGKEVALFGAFDVVAIKADIGGVLRIQTTSGSNHASHARKMLANPTLRTWLAAGNRAEVWSWAKDRRGRWTCHRTAIVLADLAGVAVEEAPRPPRRRKQEQPGLFAALDASAGKEVPT